MVVLMSGPRPRICIISDGVYPSRWTDTQQTMKTAAALADAGARVELLLARQPRRWFSGAATRRAELERFYGVRASFELTQLPGLPRLPLKINEALHGLLAPLYAARGGHDVVYSRKILPLALALASGQQVVFESHRVLKSHYPMAYRAVTRLMRHPRFLGVVTNARFVADAYLEMGVAPDAVVVAHNSYDPADVEPRLTRADARKALGIAGDGPWVCYAGHIQRRKGIDMVIAMAARTPEVRYLICGGFPDDVAAAQALARDAGARNLTFTGWIDVHQLAPYLYAADVLLVPPTAAPLRTYGNTVLPIKTYTYLACGGAILAPALDDISEVLRHNDNAWLVTPDDVDAAVAGVNTLVTDQQLRARLAAAALADSAQYTWDARARTIRDFIVRRLRAE
jgi:glycosyltransferase involved in cell wall biosynthesis